MASWWPFSKREHPAPKDLPRLPGGAPLGEVFPSAPRVGRSSTYDPLEETGDPARTLVNAVAMADAGQPRTYQLIIDATVSKDLRLRAVWATRILAITARRTAMRPPPGYESDTEAVRIASQMANVFDETPGFSRRRSELAQGIARGVGVLEHHWRVDANGRKVSRPKPIQAYRIGVAQGEWTKFDADDGDQSPGIALCEYPDKFVVHSPSGGVYLPHSKRGAMRSVLGLALAKRYGLRWWLSALERHGHPQIYGTAPASADKSFLAETVDSIRQLSSDWAAVFKSGVELKPIPVTYDGSAHEKFVTWVNTEYAIGFLGNNLTTEVQGGSFAASQTGDNVRGDYLAADLQELDEDITDQWVRPTIRFNWPGAPVPYLETVSARSRPWSIQEYQAGACTKNEYRLSNGGDATDAPGADEFLTPPSAPAFSQVPAMLTLSSGGAAPPPFPTSPNGQTSRTQRSGPANALLLK